MPTNTMRRAHGLKILNARHKEIRRLKREGHVAEIHGNKFWNSSFLIMDHLRRHPLAKRTRVLEIGCGWGLLGLYCAKRFGCRVHGIDADAHVLPYLQLHADVNEVKMMAEADAEGDSSGWEDVDSDEEDEEPKEEAEDAAMT